MAAGRNFRLTRLKKTSLSFSDWSSLLRSLGPLPSVRSPALMLHGIRREEETKRAKHESRVVQTVRNTCFSLGDSTFPSDFTAQPPPALAHVDPSWNLTLCLQVAVANATSITTAQHVCVVLHKLNNQRPRPSTTRSRQSDEKYPRSCCHMRAWCPNTRGRFECTHGRRFERTHGPPRTKQQQHNTAQNTPQIPDAQPTQSRPINVCTCFFFKSGQGSVMMLNNERFARRCRYEPPRNCALVKKNSQSFGS